MSLPVTCHVSKRNLSHKSSVDDPSLLSEDQLTTPRALTFDISSISLEQNSHYLHNIVLKYVVPVQHKSMHTVSGSGGYRTMNDDPILIQLKCHLLKRSIQI